MGDNQRADDGEPDAETRARGASALEQLGDPWQPVGRNPLSLVLDRNDDRRVPLDRRSFGGRSWMNIPSTKSRGGDLGQLDDLWFEFLN